MLNHPRTAREEVLGPLLIYVPGAGRESRVWAGVRGLVCVGLLAVAAALVPDPSGVGTHTQLGVPACRMMVLWGVPCPTCGMTTAFAHTVRGHWAAALHTQPAGFLAALATAVGAGVSAATVVTGRRWVVNWYRLPPGRVAVVVVAVVLLAWAYRIGVTLWASW
ncbi:MAG: DUF2752 domain-containing protein [Planctomycetota bacterium]